MGSRTKEPQYQIQFDTMNEKGLVPLGPRISDLWRRDPRLLGIVLARFKFCAKILAGKSSVLEVGCADGFGMRVVLQEVGSLHGIDFDPLFIEFAQEQARREGLDCTFSVLDITQEAPQGIYDGVYLLDVIEHIKPDLERRCMENICRALVPNAMCIVGTPNLTAKAYASKESNEGHVNLKDADSLRELLALYFHNVLIFSMNDEVVHTGFYPMAHYLMGIGVGVKE